MAKVPNTYLCRFCVLSDVPYQGKPAYLEHLKSDYLVFSSNFYGELEPYLEGMWNALQEGVLRHPAALCRPRNRSRRAEFYRIHQEMPGHHHVFLQWIHG